MEVTAPPISGAGPIQWDGTAEGATPVIDMILRAGGTARYHDASDGPGETTHIAVNSPSGASWRLLPGQCQWLWPSPAEIELNRRPLRDAIALALGLPTDTPEEQLIAEVVNLRAAYELATKQA